MTQSNRSWDFGRFVQTLDFFDSIPIVSWVQNMMSGANAPQPPQVQDGVLFDFTQPAPEQVAIWGALDDVVMGGVSDSGFQAGEGAARFTGLVSTENSGGFASIRTRNFDPPLNLSTYRGIELRVQGDGQRYKFFLRDRDGWDAIAYGYSFDTTPNEWVTVQIPFTELTPVFRAKTQPEAQPLDPGNIRSLQLMLSKFEYDKALNPHFTPGPFCLLVQTIAAFR
ncbi:MAG: CIA30 family protein [Leptolyngbya sp. LCM1.Bin17]|nr:MAG: CIA30 family protein [Leptolyngbya sp. LCM1.Bin17]